MIGFVCLPIFLGMWKVIFLYYHQLNMRTCSQDPPPTVIKSNNGMTHVITVQIPPNQDTKPAQNVV